MWEWSHTNEAYAAAEKNLRNMHKDRLDIIWAEWMSYGPREQYEDGFNSEAYPRHHKQAQNIPSDILADAIWERAAEQALCTNGGHEAYICPFHCGPHMVSFSDESDLEPLAERI